MDLGSRRVSVSSRRHFDLANKSQPEAWSNRGIANNAEVTVRALAYTIAGHELHHRRILEEKYFPAK